MELLKMWHWKLREWQLLKAEMHLSIFSLSVCQFAHRLILRNMYSA